MYARLRVIFLYHMIEEGPHYFFEADVNPVDEYVLKVDEALKVSKAVATLEQVIARNPKPAIAPVILAAIGLLRIIQRSKN